MNCLLVYYVLPVNALSGVCKCIKYCVSYSRIYSRTLPKSLGQSEIRPYICSVDKLKDTD